MGVPSHYYPQGLLKLEMDVEYAGPDGLHLADVLQNQNGFLVTLGPDGLHVVLNFILVKTNSFG